MISNLRFMAIFAMLFVHAFEGNRFIDVQSGLPYLVGGALNSPLVLLVHDGFGRISAPLLGLLSGYFFAANLTSSSYQGLLVKRLRTLYLPVVVWCSVFAVIQIVAAYGVGDSELIERTWSKISLNSIFGYSSWPLNHPLHYLVDLLKCILFVPIALFVFNRFGRHGYSILIIFVFLLLIAMDSNSRTPGFNQDSVLPRADLVLFFFVGLAAQRIWSGNITTTLDRFSMRRVWAITLSLVIFVLGAGHWRWIGAIDGELMPWISSFVLIATRIAGCLLLLSALQWIKAISGRGLSVDDKATFRLFTTHVITFFVLKNALEFALRRELSETDTIWALFVFPLVAVCVAYVLYVIEMYIRQARTGPTRES